MAQRAMPRRAPKKQIHKAVSKKRKFVKDGVFYAELNDFLGNELSEQGYAGCEVRVTPQRTEIIIRATNSGEVIGDNGRRIRELTALIQKRFKFPRNGLICFAEKVRNKGFSALTQAQAVKYRLLTGLTVRRAAYSCLKYIMDNEKKSGAQGCEIIVSGKLRGQRAKGMKFRDGFMIHAGDAANYYIDTAVKHVHLPQGVIGIKVKIMKPYDATGRDGVTMELPDKIQILEPKDDASDGNAGGGMGAAISRPQPPASGPTNTGGPAPPAPPTRPPRPPMPPQGGAGAGTGGATGGGGGGGGGGAGFDGNDRFNGGGGGATGAQNQGMGATQAPAQDYPAADQGAAQQFGGQPAAPQGQQFESGGDARQAGYNAAPAQQFDNFQGGQGQGGQYAQPPAQAQHYDQYGNPAVARQPYGQQFPQSGGGQQGGAPQYGGQPQQPQGGYYDQNAPQNFQNY